MADEAEVKPGYKTTEFWMSALVAVIGLVVASGAVPAGGPWERGIAFIASALATMGYTASRATAKSQ